jgi:hypothetical protein
LSAEWRQQQRRLLRPAQLSEQDTFLMTAQARAVFTMQAWREQTEKFLVMKV